MAKLDYQALYALQDRALTAVFGVETGFYLSGGTCLHRFYHERRYSDDLDLFTNDSGLFRGDLKLLERTLSAAGIGVEKVVDSRDFVRLLLFGSLKMDLVNDRVERFGPLVRTDQGVVLDNLNNIGANKVCALLGRDDPKDIFDLYTIFRLPGADWPTIMAAAAKKCVLDREELRFRLQTFPLALLDTLPVVDDGFTEELRRDYPKMNEALLNAAVTG